jgi:hypothetical protein
VEVRVADSSAAPHAFSASVLPGRETSFTLEGRAPRNEEGALLAAVYEIEALNAAGGRWGAPQSVFADARRERGVDVTATNPEGEQLFLQVTRPEQQGIWQRLGQHGLADCTRTHDEHADRLWAALEGKRRAADPRVVLVRRRLATLIPAGASPADGGARQAPLRFLRVDLPSA